MDSVFEEEGKREDSPPEESLPPLPTPDLLSALAGAPGARLIDATAWAREALRSELVKACATDRAVGATNPDIRVDAIVHVVEVGKGNAAVVVEGAQFVCAYRFEVQASYCVALSERPDEPGGSGTDHRYMGDISIPELASGTRGLEALAQCMRTSLREPKPQRAHRPPIKPVLGRLELSLAHFVRRFERRFLAYPGARAEP